LGCLVFGVVDLWVYGLVFIWVCWLCAIIIYYLRRKDQSNVARLVALSKVGEMSRKTATKVTITFVFHESEYDLNEITESYVRETLIYGRFWHPGEKQLGLKVDVRPIKNGERVVVCYFELDDEVYYTDELTEEAVLEMLEDNGLYVRGESPTVSIKIEKVEK
jgi:hypothetical protein